MTEKETANAIVKKHYDIISKRIVSHYASALSKECAKAEVQAIIEVATMYKNYLEFQHNDFEFCALEFWQGVLEEIK